MYGLIAGEMAAGVLIILFGLAYYLVTGGPPKQYSIIPG